MKKHIKLITKLFLILLLFVILLYPLESIVTPSQSILVVTDDMRPIEGALVRQIWKHYTLEDESHEEDLRTDENGRVTFEKRIIKANLLIRIIRPIWIIIRQGVHASFGPYSDIIHLGGGIPGNYQVKPEPQDKVFKIRE